MVCLDKHVIANSTFIFAFFPPSKCVPYQFLSIQPYIVPECTLNAARNAQTTVTHRKASTRTPQPQDKPKEGECFNKIYYENIFFRFWKLFFIINNFTLLLMENRMQ